MKNRLSIVIVLTAVWCAGFAAAPFVPEFPWLHAFYGVVCHQFESRTFHIGGNPLAVCGRCTGIYAGFLFGLIAVRLIPVLARRQWRAVPLIILSALPMVVSVFVEAGYPAALSNVLRSLTGAWFGTGMSLLLHASLTEFLRSLISQQKKNYEFES